MHVLCTRNHPGSLSTILSIWVLAGSCPQKHRMPASLRQLIPPAFMFLLMLLLLLTLLLLGWWSLAALAIPTLYLGTLFGTGFRLMGRLGWTAGVVSTCCGNHAHGVRCRLASGVVAKGTSSVPSAHPRKKETSSQFC